MLEGNFINGLNPIIRDVVRMMKPQGLNWPKELKIEMSHSNRLKSWAGHLRLKSTVLVRS